MRTLPRPEQHFNAHTAVSHVQELKAKAASINLPIDAVWALIVQYGSKIVPILSDVLTAFQGGFEWSKVIGLLASDGPLVMALIEQVAAALGVSLPPQPAMESKLA